MTKPTPTPRTDELRRELDRLPKFGFPGYQAGAAWELTFERFTQLERELAEAKQRSQELYDNGNRLKEATDGWKQEAQRLQGIERALKQTESQLAEAIERAELERAARDENITGWMEKCRQAEQRLAKAEKDAERYRYLRNKDTRSQIKHFERPLIILHKPVILEREADFDKSIDAVIAQEKPTPAVPSKGPGD